MTFAADIEAAANGEPILVIVIADYYRSRIKHPMMGKVITWEEARPLLDYDYDDGFGGADCNPIYAWTPTRVLFVDEYDGATIIRALPRAPMDCEPEFNGWGAR
jgi:hypothetical protein